MNLVKEAIAKIDQQNQKDPHTVIYKNQTWSKEYLNSVWMTEQLFQYIAAPSAALQIACRAHHIRRWEIQRSEYPSGKAGYYQWRTSLYAHHSSKTKNILLECEANPILITQICSIIEKKNLRKDHETQILEDVICHVFLLYYAEAFSKKHPEAKVIDILEKTWKKLSDAGKAHVESLELSKEVVLLISKSNIA